MGANRGFCHTQFTHLYLLHKKKTTMRPDIWVLNTGKQQDNKRRFGANSGPPHFFLSFFLVIVLHVPDSECLIKTRPVQPSQRARDQQCRSRRGSRHLNHNRSLDLSTVDRKEIQSTCTQRGESKFTCKTHCSWQRSTKKRLWITYNSTAWRYSRDLSFKPCEQVERRDLQRSLVCPWFRRTQPWWLISS